MSTLRVLFFGDLVGAPGRAVFQKHINALREQFKADAVLVNGENSAQGRGITPRVMNFFKQHHVNVVTSGNHIWRHNEINAYLDQHDDLVRPANFPPGCPGKGYTTFTVGMHTIGVINLQGRIFMKELVDCQFRTVESILPLLKKKTKIILVDMHAEATSEKYGLGYFLDGKVSAVVGTHTHVQTADERILPLGTAYISDLGMGGALNSMIGMQIEPIIKNMRMQMPVKFEVEDKGPMILCGVCISIDTTTGLAIGIERFRIQDSSVNVSEAS
ncbi:MAG: TIGR00282 family metallophosphoesterase [Candidatus Babeliales bacterium]